MEIARKGLIALAVLVSTAIASIPAAADGGNGAYPDQPCILRSGRAFTPACMWASAMATVAS
jgi:hypothetical protein